MDTVTASPSLNPETCRRARLSRDSRFDGEFYLAVSTTGIYCRPICPARPPAEKNVSYFRSAAQAAEAGYRPCLRCRPESAPGSPAWMGTSTTVQRAVDLIQGGALNSGTVGQLADRLGVGERYLRKLFTRELGVSPQSLAINQRLLFARKLLAETALPITQVAYAAGFGSVRRFNSAVQSQFRQSPRALRKQAMRQSASAAIHLTLHYRPPYDWPGVIDYFSRHAIAGVEQVEPGSYRRALQFPDGDGWLCVVPMANRNALVLELRLPDNKLLMPVVANIRRMFDLDAHPAAIHDVLSRDPALATLLGRFPGIRSPGCWSLFESAVRTIVGQQVSIAGARNALSRLAAECRGLAAPLIDGEASISFPAASELAALPDTAFPMPGKRRETLQLLCRDYSGREDELDIEALSARRGVGPWTTEVVTMRGAGKPDVFPTRDLGLEKAWKNLDHNGLRLSQQAQHWRPWGAYAANLLWRSLGS